MTKMTETQVKGDTIASASDSRRDFLKKAAVVAWSTPVVMTVTANRAWATHAGCVHVGEACTTATSPQAGGCCLKNTVNGNVGCCTTVVGALSARVGRCYSPIGQACANNNECCSGRCQQNVCAACNGGPTQGCINALP